MSDVSEYVVGHRFEVYGPGQGSQLALLSRGKHAAGRGGSTLREKARLVAQWHGAIGSGPLEVLDAELADLAAAVRAEPAALDVDRLARAILVAAQESDRRPITDAFEWYGSALELAEGIRAALAAEDAE